MADEATPAKGTTTDATKVTVTETEPKEGSEDKPLGKAGEKALEAFKDRARKAENDLKAAQDRLKELDEKDKTELQKAQGRVSELEKLTGEKDSAVQQLRVQIAVMGAASKVGISDPEAAVKLLDWSKIEFENDQPTNVDDLLAVLVNDKPYLRSGAGKPQGEADGGKGEPAGGESFNDAVRRQAGY